jgi:hypothetical protein
MKINMQKTYKIWAISVLSIAFIVGLTGCKSTADKVTEKVIEHATNSSVDVDSSTNTVRINTNGASWETGDSVSLPANFPDDIYVADGKLKVAIASDATQGFTVSLESTESVANLKTLYENELKSDGWTIANTIDIQGSSSVMATKAKRNVTVSIGPNEDKSKSVVSINTYTDTTPVTPNSNS